MAQECSPRIYGKRTQIIEMREDIRHLVKIERPFVATVNTDRSSRDGPRRQPLRASPPCGVFKYRSQSLQLCFVYSLTLRRKDDEQFGSPFLRWKDVIA